MTQVAVSSPQFTAGRTSSHPTNSFNCSKYTNENKSKRSTIDCRETRGVAAQQRRYEEDDRAADFRICCTTSEDRGLFSSPKANKMGNPKKRFGRGFCCALLVASTNSNVTASQNTPKIWSFYSGGRPAHYKK